MSNEVTRSAAVTEEHRNERVTSKSLYKAGDKVLLDSFNCVWVVTRIVSLNNGEYRVTVRAQNKTGWTELAATEQELEATFIVRRVNSEQ